MNIRIELEGNISRNPISEKQKNKEIHYGLLIPNDEGRTLDIQIPIGYPNGLTKHLVDLSFGSGSKEGVRYQWWKAVLVIPAKKN